MTTQSRVLLLGDESVDWHVIKAEDAVASCWLGTGGVVAAAPGGVELLRHLIDQCLTSETDPAEHYGFGVGSPLDSNTHDMALSHTMTLCGVFPQETQSKNQVLRIQSLCGFRPSQTPRPIQTEYASNCMHDVVVRS